MKFISYFNFKIVKYDLLNKFNYKNVSQVPKINKIIITLVHNKAALKKSISSLLVLELFLCKKVFFLKSKKPQISLKIHKGDPIGCFIELNKESLNFFVFLLFSDILILNKNLLLQPSRKNFYTLKVNKPFFASKLNNFYIYFKDLPKLNITFVTSTKETKELEFLLKSFKLLNCTFK